MPRRSTRNRIRYQADKALEHADSILLALQAIDLLAAGNSEVINTNMAVMVSGVDAVRSVLREFRDKL